MKIASSMVQFTARHQQAEMEVRVETRRQPVAESPAVAARSMRPPANASAGIDPGLRARLLDAPSADHGERAEKAQATEATEATEKVEEALAPQDLFRLRILTAFVEAVTGRKLELERMKVPKETASDVEPPVQAPPDSDPASGRENPPPTSGREDTSSEQLGDWNTRLNVTRESWRMEREQVDFQAIGRVRTQDGREIDLNLSMSMSRELFEYSRIEFQASDAQLKDPLVINLDASSASLTSDRMHFDIDADGSPDRIARLAAGSGFLAVDRDNDGRVTDGSELFGALSGDGFGELARHDADGNGWIDAADPIWDRLQIWLHEGDADGRLIGVGQAGIGAIFLDRAETPFALHDELGTHAGQMRHTGIYLDEDGSAGTVQKLDLVI